MDGILLVIDVKNALHGPFEKISTRFHSSQFNRMKDVIIVDRER